MRSPIDEVNKLRVGKGCAINFQNTNRHRIVVNEEDGSKTAYYFGVPIYNADTRKMVCLRFQKGENVWHLEGANTRITISREIVIDGPFGNCKVLLPGDITGESETVLRSGKCEIFPTINGLAFKVPCVEAQSTEISLMPFRPYNSIQSNDRCFSLMHDEFKPLITVSCIGTLDQEGRLVGPCGVNYTKKDSNEYILRFESKALVGKFMLYEINYYEEKLFQDTTVESRHTKLNNVFGGSAYIGNTEAYGEQWLYTRPNFTKMSDMLDRWINRAIFHVPQFTNCNIELSAYRVANRFCSFGSTWDNKVAESERISVSHVNNRYLSMDITNLLTDAQTHTLTRSEGLIIRTKLKGSGFTTIATGDCFYSPQVLEINFR